MYPELTLPFGLHLQLYGVMMALGFLSCYFTARWICRWSNRNPSEVDTLIMLAAIGGILGARIVYVIQNWGAKFAEAPHKVFAIWEGGLVFYGGFLLATALILTYAKLKRESLASLADFCVILVPLGHAFGRIGCFFFGCCYGGRTDSALGVCYPYGSQVWSHQIAEGELLRSALHSHPVWPTQLIESAGCLMLFALLLFLYKTCRRATGLCAGVYCIGYAGLRYVIECLRVDPRGATHFGLSFSQLISCGLFVVGLLFITFALRRKNNGTVCR